MPIISPHTGKPISIGSTKRQVTLTPRDGELLCHITQWEYIRNLKPMLVCRSCWNNARISAGPDLGRVGNIDQRSQWEIVLTFTPECVSAECGCSRWATEQPAPLSPWLGHRPVATKNAVSVIEATPLVMQKKEPINDSEAALLQAWKGVMDRYGWSEALKCNACFESATKTGEMIPDDIHAIVIPGKRISMICACSKREWQGIR